MMGPMGDGGASTVEFALLAPVFIALLFGVLEFTLAMGQWNAAAKATQAGARIAAVSDPVAPGLRGFSGNASAAEAGSSCQTGAGGVQAYCQLPARVVCRKGTCEGGFGYSGAAFDRIVGRMRSFWFGLSEWDISDHVEIEYGVGGLGYVGRPGGLPYTITIRLTGASFLPTVAGGMLRLLGGQVPESILMPPFTATAVAEDLNGESPAGPAH